MAIVLSVVGIAIDATTASFILAAYRKIGHVHLDIGVALMGVGCSVVAVWTWCSWWVAIGKQKREGTRLQKAKLTKKKP